MPDHVSSTLLDREPLPTASVVCCIDIVSVSVWGNDVDASTARFSVGEPGLTRLLSRADRRPVREGATVPLVLLERGARGEPDPLLVLGAISGGGGVVALAPGKTICLKVGRPSCLSVVVAGLLWGAEVLPFGEPMGLGMRSVRPPLELTVGAGFEGDCAY